MTTIKIHNIETGEIIERDMTADELKQYLKDQKNEETKAQAEATAEATKAAEKAALLAKLGISVDEAKLLLE